MFTRFVLAGVVWRRKASVHRAMMLLTSLSILAGACRFAVRDAWSTLARTIFDT